MLSILSNIGYEYIVFVSRFYSGRDSITNWKIPSLDYFVESLIQEQDKLVQMGVIHTSKNQALLVIDSNNAQVRVKHKGKETKNSDSNPKENQQYFDGALGSKKKKTFEKTRCPYCMREFHTESQSMQNTINELSTLLEKRIIYLPKGSKKSNVVQPTEYHERCHASKSSLTQSKYYLIDS